MKYERLPGKWRFFITLHTLWMESDHLLAVKSYRYSEHYTRYYFKDILAIVTHRTLRLKVWNAILGTMLGFALISLAVSFIIDMLPLTIVGGVFSALFLMALIIHIRRGPTCECRILTTLGYRELTSVKRIRHARELLDRIRPFILDNQKSVPRENSTAPRESTGEGLLPNGGTGHMGTRINRFDVTGMMTP